MKSHCKYLESTHAKIHSATHSFCSPSFYISNRFYLSTTYLVYYFFRGTGGLYAPLSREGTPTSYPSWPRNTTPIEAVQVAAGWRHAPPPKLDTSLVWRNFRPTHCLRTLSGNFVKYVQKFAPPLPFTEERTGFVLMPLKQRLSVYSNNHTKHINTLFG